MDYKKFFFDSINDLKKIGEYRIFKDISRVSGSFPLAKNNNLEKNNGIVVWCSNDYLGMGQHPFVLEAIERALHKVGAGSGGTRNISGTNRYHVLLEQEISNIHKKDSSLLFTSGYVANQSAISILGSKLKKCVIFSTKKPYFPRTNTYLIAKVSARSVSLGGCALHPPLRFCGCASVLLQNSKAPAAQQ